MHGTIFSLMLDGSKYTSGDEQEALLYARKLLKHVSTWVQHLPHHHWT